MESEPKIYHPNVDILKPLATEFVDGFLNDFFKYGEKLDYFIQYSETYVPTNMSKDLYETVAYGVLQLDPENGQQILGFSCGLFKTIYDVDKFPLFKPVDELGNLCRTLYVFRDQLIDTAKTFEDDEEKIITSRYSAYIDKIYTHLLFLQNYFQIELGDEFSLD